MHKFSGIRGGAKMEDFIKIFKTNLLAGINFYDLVLNSSESIKKNCWLVREFLPISLILVKILYEEVKIKFSGGVINVANLFSEILVPYELWYLRKQISTFVDFA